MVGSWSRFRILDDGKISQQFFLALHCRWDCKKARPVLLRDTEVKCHQSFFQGSPIVGYHGWWKFGITGITMDNKQSKSMKHVHLCPLRSMIYPWFTRISNLDESELCWSAPVSRPLKIATDSKESHGSFREINGLGHGEVIESIEYPKSYVNMYKNLWFTGNSHSFHKNMGQLPFDRRKWLKKHRPFSGSPGLTPNRGCFHTIHVFCELGRKSISNSCWLNPYSCWFM